PQPQLEIHFLARDLNVSTFVLHFECFTCLALRLLLARCDFGACYEVYAVCVLNERCGCVEFHATSFSAIKCVLQVGIGVDAHTLTFPLLYSTTHTHGLDRKSTRLNSSHVKISYAVFC